MLSHIIHDWSEEQCLTILGNCRRAIEAERPPLDRRDGAARRRRAAPRQDARHDDARSPGGQERTPSEYAALLAKAGFKLTRVVPTASAVSVVEAVPA